MPSHALQHPEVTKRLAAAPQWPSYTGVSQLEGSTADGRCTIYVDPSLGAPGHANALDLLLDADRVMKFNDAIFGSVGGPVSVIVCALSGATDGTGGADHMGCDFTTGAQIEVCASFDNSARCSGLFEAELSECSMNGQLCGLSTGEALSRWCAMLVSNNALADFASAPTWAQDGMPNFVDTVDPSDRNYDSIGCGMAYLSWLMGPEKLTLDKIAQLMVHLGDTCTLAMLALIPATAWTEFQAAIAALPSGVTSDDPFNALIPVPVPGPTGPTGATGPAPGPTGPTGATGGATGATGPAPTTTSSLELATLIGEALFADLDGGVTEPMMKADVQAILDAN